MNGPIYRVSFDAASLLRDHPPKFQHPHKNALFEIAYAPGEQSKGEIKVTRWAERVDEPLSLARELATSVEPNFYTYQVVSPATGAIEWHVNFADPQLFFAYGSPLFAQDEMQVAEHPMLACVREALLARGLSAMTSDETNATPILVRNVERRIEVATNPDASAGRPYGLYGNRFGVAPLEAVRRATRRIKPPTITNIIAIAAPAGGHGAYSEADIRDIFATAFAGFRAARDETHRILGPNAQMIIHTGFWGCGAFGGNRHLMIALQALAARGAHVDRLVLHAGDNAGSDDASSGVHVAEMIASRCGEPCSLDNLVGHVAMLGYKWGTSDGN